jgi:two-component sensor histidine kinase
MAYGLCFVILAPAIGCAAFLQNELHTRELSHLHQFAQNRASLAAASFDDRMAALLQTLKGLAATPATTTERVYENVRSNLDKDGIILFTRDSNLDLLSRGTTADAAVPSLDSPARTAGAAALSTLAPQITTYGTGEKGGVNIWIASSAEGNDAVLLQAQIPASYLSSAFKNFIADGPWSIAIVGSDGRIYAEANGKHSTHLVNATLENPSLIDGMAATSQFGWKIAVGVPSRLAESHVRRNWMTFVAISSLLAVASFTGATLLTRSEPNVENLDNPSQATGMTFPRTPQGQSNHPSASGEAGDHLIRSALQAGNVGVWQWNPRARRVHWNAELARMLNLPAQNGNRTPLAFLRLVEAPDRRRLLKALRVAVDGSTPISVEIRIRRPNRETRWIAVRGALQQPEEGNPPVYCGVAYDVTDQKLSLTRTDALLREVSHRSKNLLALILAMARLTARDAISVKSHLKDFTLRVAGLAASQDLIVASDWHSVDLATLASAEIGAVARTDADRVMISGPPLLLTPEAAQTLGMVLTELALNAVEHGALSSANGEVRLSWEFPDASTISICWRETGGPPFPAESAKGYGMSVVERFSTQGLKLSLHSTHDEDGLRWTLTGPFANIGTRAERRA